MRERPKRPECETVARTAARRRPRQPASETVPNAIVIRTRKQTKLAWAKIACLGQAPGRPERETVAKEDRQATRGVRGARGGSRGFLAAHSTWRCVCVCVCPISPRSVMWFLRLLAGWILWVYCHMRTWQRPTRPKAERGVRKTWRRGHSVGACAPNDADTRRAAWRVVALRAMRCASSGSSFVAWRSGLRPALGVPRVTENPKGCPERLTVLRAACEFRLAALAALSQPMALGVGATLGRRLTLGRKPSGWRSGLPGVAPSVPISNATAKFAAPRNHCA